MTAIIVTGMLSEILSTLTTALALVQTIAGAEGAAIAIKEAIFSVTQAIGIINALPL